MKWRKSQFKDSPLVVFSETHSDSCGMAANTIAADQFIKHHNADIDDLRAQLAACAAGPWRFDVENAPKDTPLMTWCKIHPANDGHDLRIGKLDSRSKTWTDGVWRFYVSAFAVPNPPQKPEIKS